MIEDTFVPPYPRYKLISGHSPLERAPRLEDALRDEGIAGVPRIYIKRDDLLSLALGGNKIRNLEFLIGQALADGCTDVITAGRQQSNHCRLTAATCARAGLRCHLVLNGVPPEYDSGNLVLDRLFGARMYFTGSDDRRDRQSWLDTLAGALPMLNAKPYRISVGGSDPRGALGHVLAAREILQQCDAIGEKPGTIVLATATGGTQAGLVAGLRKLGAPTAVLGFAVAKSAGELRADILAVANYLAAELALPPFAPSDIDVDGSALGEGYGVPTAPGTRAIDLLARTEGVIADPVYTGKGLAGLLDRIRRGDFTGSDAVVFIHTGGVPALFA